MSEMKAVAPERNAAVLRRAVFALARTGDDLYFEADEGGVSLRAANAAESAYCAVDFRPEFFAPYLCPEPVRCRVSARSALAAFRAARPAGARSARCEISRDPRRPDDLVLALRSRDGSVRTHRLAALDRDRMRAAPDPDASASPRPNVLTARARLFAEAADNFRRPDGRVTLETARGAAVRLAGRSETDATETRVALPAADFIECTLERDASATLPLREFRAPLAFAEAVDRPVSVRLSGDGRPVSFVVAEPGSFEANFVAAAERAARPRTDGDRLVRTVFRRCLGPPSPPGRPPPEVLVPDSDGE